MGITRSLIGGAFEIVVAQSAAAASAQDNLFAVLYDFTDYLARLGIAGNGSQRDFQNYVLAVGSCLQGPASVSARLDFDVLFLREWVS